MNFLKGNSKSIEYGEYDNLNDTKNGQHNKNRIIKLKAFGINEANIHIGLEGIILNGFGIHIIPRDNMLKIVQDNFFLNFSHDSFEVLLLFMKSKTGALLSKLLSLLFYIK